MDNSGLKLRKTILEEKHDKFGKLEKLESSLCDRADEGRPQQDCTHTVTHTTTQKFDTNKVSGNINVPLYVLFSTLQPKKKNLGREIC